MEFMFLIAGAALGWVGAYLQRRWQRDDRDRTALREAYAEALARLEQYLDAYSLLAALHAEEDRARAELQPLYAQTRLELQGNEEALAKLADLEAAPPDPDLRKRLHDAVDAALAAQHALTIAKHRLLLLETDAARLEEVRHQFRQLGTSGTDRQADLDLINSRQLELEVFTTGLGRALKSADGQE